MKLLGFLNLRGVSRQIAALVVASIITFHLILAVTFLIYRPDQSIDPGHSQLTALVQLLGAVPAAGRSQLLADGAGVPATDGCKRWRDGVFRSAPAFTSIAVVLLALIAPDTSGYA